MRCQSSSDDERGNMDNEMKQRLWDNGSIHDENTMTCDCDECLVAAIRGKAMSTPTTIIYVVYQGRYEERDVSLVTLDVNKALEEFNKSPKDSQIEAWENDEAVRTACWNWRSDSLEWSQ